MRTMNLRFLPKILLTLTAVGVMTGGLASCNRIKAKLERLAAANQPPKAEPVPTALTPEEERINRALENPELLTVTPEQEAPKAQAFELNRSSIVSVLGYHDFRERGGTPMMIAADKFRLQMQAIRDSKIPVISMRDLLAWKRGEKNIPEESIVITMDDGWVGVYQYAYPVLKEMGFPFTIYLYKKYVNSGGRSLTWAQIREMMENGAEVGSHSVSHENMTSKHGKNDAAYQEWIVAELRESKEFLEKNLGVPMMSFAYPYGNHNEDIMKATMEAGYAAAVTVSPQKTSWDSEMGRISRYIIHGDSDTNFKMATSFNSRGSLGSANVIASDARTEDGSNLVDLMPRPDSTIVERRPLISAGLARMGSIDPTSLKMRVSGLGAVPVTFDPSTLTVRYQLPHKLRREECTVTLTFQRTPEMPAEIVSWRFKINLASSYLPNSLETPMAAPEKVGG